jgi:hypothetical protein
MARHEGKDLEAGLHGINDISGAPPGRTGTGAPVVGVADDAQPQAVFLQMGRHIFGKGPAFSIRRPARLFPRPSVWQFPKHQCPSR